MDTTTFRNVINNELTTTAEIRHGINPATAQPNPPLPVATREDLNRAVDAAQQAFKKWSKTTFEQRRAALHAYADAIEENKDALAAILTMEQGKPLTQSSMEIGFGIQWVREIPNLKIPENVIEDTEERRVVQRHTPIGVVCAIVPWNFPVLLTLGKIAPAVYTGNTVIVKPSPFTPYCGLKLAELATKFFPAGVVQALSGDDSLGPWCTEHPGIGKINFTGSSRTGQLVMASCAKTIKRVTLELGGNDPCIICDDVDLDVVVPKIGIFSFLCTSQICMMIKRLYVHERIYDEFRTKLAEFVKSLPVGDGTKPETFFGPVQNAMQFEKVKDLFVDTTKSGYKIALGGDIPSASPGYFVQPTIVDNPPEDSRIVQEEPFGPILPMMKWSDEDDVIARANGTDSALGASVWTKDMDRATRMADQLVAGSVWVNSHFDISPNAPFGGHKGSGLGTEWGINGLLGYCNSQTLWLKKSP
ncbi:hypothetical protein SI65_08854 [Aspergillus cristatus]|uniref:aldehyde dehydrogenase (NAD(+)) n=1 Tax=Aspergillus cristatus TaxID=573508 RepID=A0A1E3B3T9_ASPCR|nr:hypothetical protein SI65_08854 [Aspergillus cristatus]